MRQYKFLIYVLLIVAVSCAKPHQPITKLPSQPNALAELRSRLQEIFEKPEFSNAFWGVAIESVDSDEILYEQNSGKLLMPASNMKILTAIAALKTLGADFTYQTKISADQPIQDGVLKGNLIVIGSGDPTISSDTLKSWALELKEQGLNEIQGNIVGDDSAFEDLRLGFGWSWDDLPYYYATETSALQFAENAITVTITAGEANQPVTVKKEPDTSYIQVVENVQVASIPEPSIQWKYDPETRTVFVSGTLPISGSDYGGFSIYDPALYFAQCFKETLEANGIRVLGSAKHEQKDPLNLNPIAEHHSPPLSEILSVLLKRSQNLYAETLLKTLGNGKASEGIKIVQTTLHQMGVSPDWMVITDGSGLSRYNYVTPKALTTMLRAIYREDTAHVFYQALPAAGVDGTLKSRMKGTPAENNVHAKTGSIENVRTLSGYVKTLDGEMLVFSLLANNFNVPAESANAIQDHVVELLAGFKR